MNFHQINARFDAVDLRAGYINYKYKPVKKIEGLKQHIYKTEIYDLQQSDTKIYTDTIYKVPNSRPITAVVQKQTKKVARSRSRIAPTYTGRGNIIAQCTKPIMKIERIR